MSCMMAYDEGGAAAVFRSPECPDWKPKPIQNQTLNCQFATMQGWREYQEDRVSCDLDLKIPFLGTISNFLVHFIFLRCEVCSEENWNP